MSRRQFKFFQSFFLPFKRFLGKGLIIALLALLLQGCLITVNSISVPSTALPGQTITILLQGSGCDDNPFTNPDGVVLQIPLESQVIDADGLTFDASVISGYTPEPGYQLWGGAQSTTPGGSCSNGTSGITKKITLKINDTVSRGTYYIKAAVRGFSNGAWTNMSPGQTDFAQISGANQSNAMIITDTGIGITYPAGNDDWFRGATNVVSWIYAGNVGTNVNIDLYHAGTFYKPIVSDVSIGSNGSGAFDWPISCDVGDGAGYQIMVTSTSDISYNALSNPFAIWSPQINTTDPYSGDTIYNNIVHRIKWSYPACLDGDTVTIDLCNGGNMNSIATGVVIGSGGNGYYDWTPSAGVGTGYYICVTPTSTGSGACTPQFPIDICPQNKVFMSDTYYDALQSAYDAIPDSTPTDIYAQATDFAGDFVLDVDNNAILHGGYDCGYGNIVGFTTVHGQLTISQGSLTVNNLAIANTGGITFATGTGPTGIAFDGVNMWVANSGSNTVTKLRANDGALMGTYNVGTLPIAVAFDGENIWVANNGTDNVTKLKASDGTLVGTYATGSKPSGVTFDGSNIWVANDGSDNVTKLKASDGSFIGTYQVGSYPVGIVFDGTNIWVSNSGSGNVTKLKANDGSLVGIYQVGFGAHWLAFDGENIWVPNAGSGNVTKLRASDGSLVGTYVTGDHPYSIAFDGTNIWVTNFNSNSVTQLRASDGALQGTYAVGTNPFGVAFDGTNIWVTNYGSGSASKL